MEKVVSFVLKEVIDDLVNNKETLVTSLTKLAYFGRLIKNQELIDYTSRELTGYPKKPISPDYRRQLGKIIVTIENHDGKYIKEIPGSMFDSVLPCELKYVDIKEEIEIVELWAKQAKEYDNDNENLGREFPMELLPIIRPVVNKLYPFSRNMYVTKMFIKTSPTLSIKIINYVRLNLLDMAYRIADGFGDTIMINSFKPDQKLSTQLTTIMKQIVNHGDGNITSMGDNSPINATVNIEKGDLKGLRNEFKKQGLEDSDIDELEVVLKDFKHNDGLKDVPVPVNNWLGKMYGKALNSGGQIATSAIGGVITEAIKHFLNIP